MSAGHDRTALEMAREEPEVRLDVELGNRLALAMLAARLADLGDAIEHQHRRQRQLRICLAAKIPPHPRGTKPRQPDAPPPSPPPKSTPQPRLRAPPPPPAPGSPRRTPRTTR